MHIPEEQRIPEQMVLFSSLQSAIEQISITLWSEYHAMIRLLYQIKGMSYFKRLSEREAQEKLLRAINIRCDMVEFLPEPVAPESTVVAIRPLQLLGAFGLDPNSPKLLPRDNATGGFLEIPARVVHLDAIGVTRWELASLAMKTYPEFSTTNKARSEAKGTIILRMSNWPNFIGTMQVIVVGLVGTLYGGLHAAAWNGFFPTHRECIIWRFSALTIAVSGCIFALWMIIVNISDFKNDELFRKVQAFVIIFYVGALLYVLARIFLIAEAFASLRDLPVTAYDTPSWSQFIPHL